VAIVKVMLNTQLKLGLDYKPLAQPADLAGMKTLVVSVGASTKGLGAAGLDMDKEIARTTSLVKAAKAAGIRILVMHTGGEARRGKTSNDLIQIVAPEADYIVVVSAGNKDKLFNTLAAARNVPVAEVAKMADAGSAVKAVFKQ
jgi:2,4-dienoyl-CoA reductase-like NADH-dependent reductase (Old Yellow Enzyme family)